MTDYNKVTNMSLSDMEPYILGKQFTGVSKDVPRLNKDVFENFLIMLSEQPIAKEFFEAYSNYKDFYATAVDFKNLIPKEFQMEVFYAAKVGSFYVEVPSFCVYMLKQAWDQANGIPNLILKLVPVQALTEWFKKGYFLGGLTLRDIICNVCCGDYNPLSETKLKNRVGDFTEIWVKDTDMVAAVPNKIADMLDDSGILQIVDTDSGLQSNGVLLRTMAGYVGAINSKYDLRELI
ncbi:MAG: hypothetical protein NC548_31445 [Lachnospiraceae bacterium]|nr:hypothetical protein [Lachnospiraceae bacterium]